MAMNSTGCDIGRKTTALLLLGVHVIARPRGKYARKSLAICTRGEGECLDGSGAFGALDSLIVAASAGTVQPPPEEAIRLLS